MEASKMDNDNNLALGKLCTINQAGVRSISNISTITDGNKSTMWSSDARGTLEDVAVEVVLDLGSSQIFNKIVLSEEGQKANQLIVSLSDDNAVWNEVYNQTLMTTDEMNRVITVNVDNLAARYIKLLVPSAASNFGIFELEVYHIASFSNMIIDTDLYGGSAKTVSSTRENFHLYLLIGQSNMASRAPIEPQDVPAISRTYLFNGLCQWEEAGAGLVINYRDQTVLQGLNRYSSVEVKSKRNGLSLGSCFAKAITDEFAHIEVGIVSNACGGTTLDQWQKGSGTNLYEEAVRRMLEAMKTGTLKGILWHQGEGDVQWASTYMSRLKGFVSNLRKDLGMPDVPFIAGQIMPGKSIAFDNVLATIDQHISNSDWVSSEGTSSTGDGTHFDNASQKLLGLRYAERIKAYYKHKLE